MEFILSYELIFKNLSMLINILLQHHLCWLNNIPIYGCTMTYYLIYLLLMAFHFHALEKEMATHSSVLAWRIPGMGKPGGLLSMGSHRVRHD